jgi:hypothetical protein
MSRWAGQLLWTGVPVGSRFGMYPAIEIDLHLVRICAAHRVRPAAPEGAFRAPNVRHQPAPHRRSWRRGPAEVRSPNEPVTAGRKFCRCLTGRGRWCWVTSAVESNSGFVGKGMTEKGPTPRAPRRRPTSLDERPGETDREQSRHRVQADSTTQRAERQSMGQIVCRTDSFRDRGTAPIRVRDAEVVGSAYPKKLRSWAATRFGVPVSAAAV